MRSHLKSHRKCSGITLLLRLDKKNGETTNDMKVKPKSEACHDGQDIEYQGPDNVLTTVVSGNSIEYTNILLSSPEAGKSSGLMKANAHEEQDTADSKLREPIYNKNDSEEDCAIYQGPDIPKKSC